MAIVVGIVGESGDGKTTSVIISPDGSIPFNEEGQFSKEAYKGMDPASTVIIHADGKQLPFHVPGFEKGKNVFPTSDIKLIKEILSRVNSTPAIKTVIIDTINAIMVDREMLDMRSPSYDKWKDLAFDIYSLIVDCNTKFRPDLVVYMMAHAKLYTDVDGEEAKGISTNGKKLEKVKLESKLSIVLYTHVRKSVSGDNEFFFETRKSRSTAKTPLGMFSQFRIPNSLKLVDNTIRAYYSI